MRFIRVFQYVAMILLISTLGVKFARAAEGSLELTLDQGFVGRPISLDLFEKAISIHWNEHALAAATKLTAVRGVDGVFQLHVDSSSAFASGTVAEIKVASPIVDHPALKVVDADGVERLYAGEASLGFVKATIALSSEMTISAVADEHAVQMAAVDGSIPVSETDQKTTLTLDSGFLNRPVSLDVFNGDVTVAWDAKTLIKPTNITIISTRGGVWKDQVAAANGVKILFDDPTAVSASGVFTIRHRALRPPKDTERPDVNVYATATSTRSASFSGTSILYSVPAASGASYAPVYCSGIMRTGLASWYKYKGCLCAASPDVPKGTLLKVSRQDDPSKSVIVKVNDYGPDRKKHPERVIDLDKVAFSKIGNTRGGVLAVTVEPYNAPVSNP